MLEFPTGHYITGRNVTWMHLHKFSKEGRVLENFTICTISVLFSEGTLYCLACMTNMIKNANKRIADSMEAS